jgi:hypothetical protein
VFIYKTVRYERVGAIVESHRPLADADLAGCRHYRSALARSVARSVELRIDAHAQPAAGQFLELMLVTEGG